MDTTKRNLAIQTMILKNGCRWKQFQTVRFTSSKGIHQLQKRYRLFALSMERKFYYLLCFALLGTQVLPLLNDHQFWLWISSSLLKFRDLTRISALNVTHWKSKKIRSWVSRYASDGLHCFYWKVLSSKIFGWPTVIEVNFNLRACEMSQQFNTTYTIITFIIVI